MTPLVTVITATTGNPLLLDCLKSVKNQTYKNIQHLVIVDGPERAIPVYAKIEESGVFLSQGEGYRIDVLELPYSIGKDRWNGHRIYAAGSYMADGDYVIFLDDDNYLDPDHIDKCLAVIKKGNQWAYSFRKIVDKDRKFLCYDNCESLGKWASVLHPQDFFIDVNCYFLPRALAVQISPVWFRKFREPGQMEVDRALCHVLRQIAPTYDTTYGYSLNYTVGNTEHSVKSEFFDTGNRDMVDRYNGELPWVKIKVE
jgi:glycosyltransferase involved in cell wall biosynthesis